MRSQQQQKLEQYPTFLSADIVRAMRVGEAKNGEVLWQCSEQ